MGMLRYSLFLFLISICACTVKKAGIARVWLFDEEHLVEGSRYPLATDASWNPACFLNLQSDGRYTLYQTEWDTGKWLVRDGMLLLLNGSRKFTEYKLGLEGENEMILIDKRRGVEMRFLGYSNHFSSPEENPFSTWNNRWRIRADHKESNTEIGARIRNHFRYWETYYNWAGQAKVGTLSVSDVPSFFEMYGNGYELRRPEDQPQRWKQLFFDSADCYKAYEKMYYLMYAHNVKWTETENRYAAMSSAFRQMQGWLTE